MTRTETQKEVKESTKWLQEDGYESFGFKLSLPKIKWMLLITCNYKIMERVINHRELPYQRDDWSQNNRPSTAGTSIDDRSL